jgi:hypothetical protein
MKKKMGYLLAGAFAVALLQWAVPNVVSAVSSETQEESKDCSKSKCPYAKKAEAGA